MASATRRWLETEKRMDGIDEKRGLDVPFVVPTEMSWGHDIINKCQHHYLGPPFSLF